MKNPAGAENPRPMTPIMFVMRDACVMKRSICRVLMRGSRKFLRSVGSANRISDDTRALRARAEFTVAKGQWSTRETYCGKRTSILTARPLMRKTRMTVSVGLGTWKRVRRDW